VVMEWMVTISGEHVGYPGGLGKFFSKEKNFGGSKNSHAFWRQILVVELARLFLF